MRLRNNPKANDILFNCDYVIDHPEEFKGKWHELFNNHNPIYIEIGMGKGDFIIQNAIQYPEINFIGIEKYPTVLAASTSKLIDKKIDNLYLIKYDASLLTEVFNENEIDRIFLNFSDPWPKNRHEKRRLTYKSFLNIYKKLLKEECSIIFKTDNRQLFEYSIQSFNEYGVYINDICLDLHNSPEYDNIETEYERKFSVYGPIYRIDISFKNNE